MPTFDFKGKNIAVFGLGKAGKSTIDFLRKEGSFIFAWDDNEESCKALASDMVARKRRDITIAPPDTYLWGGIDMLVLSPGIPLTHPKPHPIVEMANAVRCPVVCDIELLYLKNPAAKYIGITGTNGKSTTTALTYHILKSAGFNVEMGGNIGVAATSLPPLGADGFYVLEVSSYQLDLLHKTKFDIAVLLNITPDHIDRHGNMAGYIESKKKIFFHQASEDTAIIAIDDENTKAICNELKSKNVMQVIPVSGYKNLDDGVSVRSGFINDSGGKKLELGVLKTLPGEHNQQNIACAYAAAKAAGVSAEKIISGIKTYPGLDHRLQFIAEIDGVTFINDSKATNADATQHALKSFENIYWIAGGLQKEGGIAPLENLFPRVSKAFLIGKAENDFAVTLEGKVPYEKCGTLENAVKVSFAKAKENGGEKPVVLLSPACASFDQFKSFEERGYMFRDFVKALAGGK